MLFLTTDGFESLNLNLFALFMVTNSDSTTERLFQTTSIGISQWTNVQNYKKKLFSYICYGMCLLRSLSTHSQPRCDAFRQCIVAGVNEP